MFSDEPRAVGYVVRNSGLVADVLAQQLRQGCKDCFHACGFADDYPVLARFRKITETGVDDEGYATLVQLGAYLAGGFLADRWSTMAT